METIPGETTMRAIFLYPDNSIQVVLYPNQPKIHLAINKEFHEEPIICYFEGRLNPQDERSVSTCHSFTRWQHWCLRQTRTYEE